MIRSQETATPLADALTFANSGVAGLQRNRCRHFRRHAGEHRGHSAGRRPLPASAGSPGTARYRTSCRSWAPRVDPNGIAFDENFGGAVQTIYDGSVGSSPATSTDAVFSHEGAIRDLDADERRQPGFRARTPRVRHHRRIAAVTPVKSSSRARPEDWTLVSWDGDAVPQDPGLPTELFVDFRSLIEAPQFADTTSTSLCSPEVRRRSTARSKPESAEVDTALAQFPVAVFDDIVGAI